MSASGLASLNAALRCRSRSRNRHLHRQIIVADLGREPTIGSLAQHDQSVALHGPQGARQVGELAAGALSEFADGLRLLPGDFGEQRPVRAGSDRASCEMFSLVLIDRRGPQDGATTPPLLSG
jgi:hypothetical protein